MDCGFHIESCQNDSKARVLQKASSPSSAKFIEIAHRSGTWSMQKTKLKGARAACFGKLPGCLDDPSGKWVKPHMDWWFVFVAIKSGSWKFGNMISLYVLPVTYPCVQDQLLKKSIKKCHAEESAVKNSGTWQKTNTRSRVFRGLPGLPPGAV